MKGTLAALGSGAAGVFTLAIIILFRDQLPLSRQTARIGGLTILYAGMALVAWAAWNLRSAGSGTVPPRGDRLVVTGPYRFVRHPVYAGLIVALGGASLTARSLYGLLATLLTFLPAEMIRARLEDEDLGERFGEEWRDWAARTGGFIPGSRRP